MTLKPVSDPTFDTVSLYASDRWVASSLGRTVDWLRKHKPELEVAGFPPADPITGMRIKADVIAWVEQRRRVPDAASRSAVRSADSRNQSGARFHAF